VPYIDETATAKQLGLETKTLRNWRLRGYGPPFFKFGGAVRYDPALNDAWARDRQAQSTTEAQAHAQSAGK
jgi:hypothetical protein